MRARCAGWFCLLLVGCSAVPVSSPKLATAESRLGSSPGFSETTITGADGVKLYARAWSPQGVARANFVIVHGLRDHGDRYRTLGRELNKRGIAVYAMDLRGHGRSEGRRAAIDKLNRHADDLDVFVRNVRAESSAPLFVFGHSMGGAIAALYAERPSTRIDGLVLSAPALELFVSPLQVCAANLLADLAPDTPAFEIDMAKWSRDKAVVANNERDPLVYQSAAAISTAVALIEGAAEALYEAPFVRVPLLAMHGGADGISDPEGSKAFVAASRSSDKRVHIYPGLYHDLWHEPERALLTKDLIAWINGRLPSTEASIDDVEE